MREAVRKADFLQKGRQLIGGELVLLFINKAHTLTESLVGFLCPILFLSQT